MAQIYKCDTCGSICEATRFPENWVVVTFELGGDVQKAKAYDVCNKCLSLPITQSSAKGVFSKLRTLWPL